MRLWLSKHNVSPPILLLGGCLLWSFWPVIAFMADRWSSDPRYAHGYFVPMFSLALLWMRRARLSERKPGQSAWGLAFMALAASLQLVAGYLHVEMIDGLALLVYLGGVSLLLGGRQALEWAWPAIAFLIFMVPLPWRVETALGPPLQSIATKVSTYLLQTLGFMAFAEGNVIHLNDARIGVVEACSGLSMLITFIALSTAAALVVRRPLVDKFALVISAIPVALVANIIRITVTGILHDTVGGHAADTFYHDLAGWLMIPLALILYWLEIWVLARILIEVEPEAPAVLDLVRGHQQAGAKPASAQRYKPSVL